MPVTARLSRLFYERLGEQIANELVDWFNLVDATYRADLRELNDANWARIEAKFEQVDRRFEQMEARLDVKLDAKFGEIKAELERRLGEQTRWMFVAWSALLIPIIGLWFR